MSNNILDALPVAEQVRDATAAGENTALRVGGCLVDIITKADLDLINIQNVLAAMPTDPFDAVLDDWANHTGAQLIEFESNGTVVASLSLLLATTSYSGLLSPTDKAKIDAMPADPASESNAVGSFNTQTTATSADIIPYTVDNSPLPSVSLPVTLRDILQGGAYQAGVVAAATQNAIDLYGQGLEVKVPSGQTLTLLLSGTRLYKGGTLQFTELDGTDCQGFLTVEIDGLGVPLFNDASFEFFSGGTTLSFKIGDQMAGVGYTGEYGVVTVARIRAVVGRDLHIRMCIGESHTSSTDVHDLTVTQTGTYVRLFGKNGGTIISQVDIPFASATKAGIVSIADYTNWQEGYLSRLYNVDVYYENNRVVLEGQTMDGTYPTSYINAATATAAGVLSAAMFNKLAGIETGAQRNIQSDWSDNDNTSAAYIANKPTIGTAAALNAPALGNASSSEVVKGNDTRLTDARPASDVSAWAKSPTPPVVTKADVGLGNVDNTSDLNKPISTATQTALDGKQDVLPIETTSAGATLDASADKYYVLTSAVGTLAITLPTMTDTAKVHTIGIYLTTGATPAITITGTNTIQYDDTWSIDANATHEINALWNGSAWVLTLIHAA